MINNFIADHFSHIRHVDDGNLLILTRKKFRIDRCALYHVISLILEKKKKIELLISNKYNITVRSKMIHPIFGG